MIGVEKIGEIRRAYFEQHRSIKEIVRTLSVSRATVRKVGTSLTDCWTSPLMNSERCRWCSALSVMSAKLAMAVLTAIFVICRNSSMYSTVALRRKSGSPAKTLSATTD